MQPRWYDWTALAAVLLLGVAAFGLIFMGVT